jgi:DNA-binding NarL/FixJ family response regulator
MKVFLVEDSPHICERLKELLEADGNHEVFGCADTFETAVQGILACKPDVGIFDIQLKHGSGIDAFAEAKRRLPELVGIILSNKVTARYMAAAANAGATHVLDKSSDFERIPEILAGLPKT